MFRFFVTPFRRFASIPAFPRQVSYLFFGFALSALFLVGAYLVIHASILYSQKPQNVSAAAAPPAATAGTSKSIATKSEIEMPEKEALLQSESTASPRTTRGGETTVPRKNGNSGSTPV